MKTWDKQVERQIGKTIKDARLAHNWSQEHLAGLVGISRNYLSTIERDGANISHEIACRFMAVLGISLVELHDGLKLETEQHIILDQLKDLRDALNETLPPTALIAKERARALDVARWSFLAYDGDLDRICRHLLGMSWEYLRTNYGAVANVEPAQQEEPSCYLCGMTKNLYIIPHRKRDCLVGWIFACEICRSALDGLELFVIAPGYDE